MNGLQGNDSSISRHLQSIYDLNLKISFDRITYKHSLNVAYYSIQFVRNAGYDMDESLVYYAALFHDIGKIHIHDSILNKPSALNRNEFEIIKKHPYYGQDILMQANFPKEVLEAAKYHHERYDGTGYPFGLKADKIPTIAKIVAICDVFDALTSDRPYRKGYPISKALEIMKNSHGHFDPELLRQFTLKIPKKLRSYKMKLAADSEIFL